MGLAASPFIVDDAIVGLSQPLTEALNSLAGGSSGRTARAVFHDAHLPDKLPGANSAEKDGVAIEFPEYVDDTAEYEQNTVRWISLSEEDLPFGKVRASHWSPFKGLCHGGGRCAESTREATRQLLPK